MTTPEDYVEYGFAQDTNGFIGEVNTRLQSQSPEVVKKVIDDIDRKMIIGPDQYALLTNLVNAGGTLSIETLLKSISEYKEQVGGYAFESLGAIFHAFETLPEWEGKEFSEILQATVYASPEDERARNLRHEAVKLWVTFKEQFSST